VQFLVLGVLVLLVIVVLIARFHREGTTPPASISPQEQQAIDAAISLAEKNWPKISKLSFKCVSFGEPDRSSKGELRIDVREVHNATCGGDLNTAPHVTTPTINLASGKVSYEAFVDGEYKAVPLN
jgi:hypothetical protein